MFYALINEYDEGSLWSIIKFSPEKMSILCLIVEDTA